MPTTVVSDLCSFEKARWDYDPATGTLYSKGCPQTGNVLARLTATGAGCADEAQMGVAITTNAPNQVILFMSECATRSVNGFA
jgi:hypothetical protein